VHVRAWVAAYRGLLTDASLDALSVKDKEIAWKDALADDDRPIWVAEQDGQVLGFVATGPVEGDAPDPDTGEVYAIYIEPDLLGTGLGGELFAHAVDGLRRRGFTRAVLWVLEGNERARRFYEKAGWVADGVVTEQRMDCENRPTVRYAADL
jgi:GNAT superfamily N-acetyltransferase